MKWRKLLHSRPPSTVWFLGPEAVTIAVRQRSGVWASTSITLDGKPFTLGAVGLHTVDADVLGPQLASLQEQAQGEARPLVVLSSAWVRCHILELSGLPRKRSEMEDVVRWRLKKVIAVPPSELRMALVLLGKTEDRHRLLCVVGLERAMSALEAVFGSFAVEPGVMVPKLFAVPLEADGWRILFEADPRSLAIQVVFGKELKLVRVKALSSTADPVASVRRELRLLVAHLRDVIDGDEDIALTIVGSDPVLTAEGWAVVDGESGLTRYEPRPLVETSRAQMGTAERLVLSALEEGRR